MTIDNYPKHGLVKKRYHLAHAYLMEKQRGLCLICGIHQPYVCELYNSKFQIDHCHKTGKIRGLLCPECNAMLGFVENLGCEALHTKIPLDEWNKNDELEWERRLSVDPTFRKQYETGKILPGRYTEETYRDMHERIDRWMDKHKYAVYRYLSLPRLNEEIETYCNQFMRQKNSPGCLEGKIKQRKA